ncbi:MAG: DNA-directed RNA polymerase subunit delta [Firmicutes bacterium]|nr:DNA-directed RNA polymerase subunit delta [Bacillota bacterium]
MLLKDMSKEDVELLSYTDLTNLILTENKSSMNTPTIFKKICDLLGYSEEEYMDKIGDFYTSLTIDKRFVLLENHEWDLRERHAVELVLDDEDEDDEEALEEENEEEVLDEEVEDDMISSEDELDTDDDDLDDLTVISDEEDEL